MSIDMIKGAFDSIAQIKPLQAPQKTEQTPGINTDTKKGSFKELFTEAIKDVNNMQTSANQSISDMVLGKNGVTTHDAMIALEKADAAFQLMNNVRSKIIRAYEEVLRTQV